MSDYIHADASGGKASVAKSHSHKRRDTVGLSQDKARGAPPSKASNSSSPDQPEPKDRQAVIAAAAYYRAELRNFSPGYELDDWLAAEREIDATPLR
jgi:hypothetical protein